MVVIDLGAMEAHKCVRQDCGRTIMVSRGEGPPDSWTTPLGSTVCPPCQRKEGAA